MYSYPLLVDGIRNALEGHVVGLVEFFPILLVFGLILLLGAVVASKVQPIVTTLGRRIELDEKVRRTPFDALFSDGEVAVSRTFGLLARYYVLLVTFFVAIEWLIHRYASVSTRFISNWAVEFFGYVPPILMGTVVLFLGFYLASHAADQVRQSPVAKGTGFSPALAGGTKMMLYFVVLVIGLDTMGVDVTILHTFAQGIAYGVGLAVALAVGIAFGWGGKDYVAENIENWLENSKQVAHESPAATSDD